MKIKEWNPAKALELSGSYWQACTLQAAVKLGIFQAIDNKNLESEEIAHKLQAERRGIKMLLNALTAMNLLTKSEDKFSNTSFSKTFLSRKSSRYIGYMIMHQHYLMDSWSRLAEAVKKGKALRKSPAYTDKKELRESFLMGMFNLAMNVAPQLAKKMNLSNRRRLLDLGGGPGTYAIHFCLNNPQLKAAVFDLPTTRPFAEGTIKKFRLSRRIKYLDGDYLKNQIKGTYDVAFLSHILHSAGLKDCQKIIRKAVSVLEPGGMIIVHEFILDKTLDGPLFPAIFSLNMLLGTKAGQSYSEKQIMDMLTKAGVKKIHRLSFKGTNDSGVITGFVE